MEITVGHVKEALDYVEYDHYGLPVIEINEKRYAVGNPVNIQEAVVEYCRDNIQHFKPELLAENSKFSTCLFKRLQDGGIFDSYVYLELINDLESFAEAAKATYGRGHFLATYDGEEIEVYDNKKNLVYYIYRIK